jgi:hypothetical protein
MLEQVAGALVFALTPNEIPSWPRNVGGGKGQFECNRDFSTTAPKFVQNNRVVMQRIVPAVVTIAELKKKSCGLRTESIASSRT